MPIGGSGSTEMRCVQPMQYLQRAGWSAGVGCVYRHMPRARHAIVFHRVLDDAMTRRAVELARGMGCRIVYDIDDLLFDQSALDHHAQYGSARPPGETVAAYLRAMHMADVVTCSTMFLKQGIDRFHPRCVVMRNGVSERLLALAHGIPPRAADAARPVTLAYFSGSAYHDRDFLIVKDALIRILQTYPEARLLLVGKLHFGDAFEPFGSRFEYRPFVPYREFMPMLGEADINLAPLDQNDPFAQARSALKYVEAGAFGVPTVASPTETYREAIDHGRNGLLSGDADWFDTLAGLIGDPDRRLQLGHAAKADISENYGPATRAAQWDSLIREQGLTRPGDFVPRSDFWSNARQRGDIWKRKLRRGLKRLR